MTFPGLQCFIVVAQELSYSRAAEKLFISQPGVSKHIKMLEMELGAALFDKSNTKKLTLTPAGKIFYDCVIRCSNDLNSAKEQIKLLSLSPAINFNYIEGNTFQDDLFQTFDIFQKQIRPTELYMHAIQQKDIISAMNHDQLVFVNRSELPPGDYSKVLIYKDVPLFLIASSQHPAFMENAEPALEDFKGSAFFFSKGYTPEFCTRNYNELFSAIGFEPETVGLLNYESIRFYLKANRGFTIGSALNESFNSADLCRVPLPITTDYYLIWRQKRFFSKYLHELISILQKYRPY